MCCFKHDPEEFQIRDLVPQVGGAFLTVIIDDTFLSHLTFLDMRTVTFTFN